MVRISTNMLSKDVFDKVIFNKVKFEQIKWNFDEIDTEQPKIHRKIHTSLWILKISRKKSTNKKSWDFCQMFVISKKKTIP